MRAVFLLEALDAGTHRRAGRQAVVDQYYSFLMEIREDSIAAVMPFLSLQLGFRRGGHSFNLSVTHTSHSDEIAVQHANATTRDRADREFLLPRQAQLAHDEDVERNIERRGHLEPHGDSASRKGKDEYVGPVRIDAKFGGEPSTSIVAVTKSRTHTLASCADSVHPANRRTGRASGPGRHRLFGLVLAVRAGRGLLLPRPA
jgi:hypothetical protein